MRHAAQGRSLSPPWPARVLSREASMERYTIRILYRDRENPGKLVGVVEAED